MYRFSRAYWISTGLVLLLQSAADGADFSEASVDFAPGYEAALQAQYGAQEPPALVLEVVESVSAALKAAPDCTVGLDVIIERASPSHPTRKQLLDDPTMDPVRSVFLNGGAELTGHVHDAEGHVIATIRHQHFVDDLQLVSPATDPWSDARLAIEQFTARLIGACKRLSSASDPSD